MGTPAGRQELYAQAMASWGTEAATELLTGLAPMDWSEVATKSDLAQTGEVLGAQIDGHASELRGEMNARFGEQSERIGGLRGEIGGLRGEMNAKFGEHSDQIGGLRGEIGGLRGEMAELRGDLRGEMAALRYDMAKQVRISTLSTLAMFISGAGLALAAVTASG